MKLWKNGLWVINQKSFVFFLFFLFCRYLFEAGDKVGHKLQTGPVAGRNVSFADPVSSLLSGAHDCELRHQAHKHASSRHRSSPVQTKTLAQNLSEPKPNKKKIFFFFFLKKKKLCCKSIPITVETFLPLWWTPPRFQLQNLAAFFWKTKREKERKKLLFRSWTQDARRTNLSMLNWKQKNKKTKI